MDSISEQSPQEARKMVFNLPHQASMGGGLGGLGESITFQIIPGEAGPTGQNQFSGDPGAMSS